MPGENKTNNTKPATVADTPENAVGIPAPRSAAHSSIESKGNSDAKLLAKAFEEYSEGGMTAEKREKIKKLDDILKDADIIISKNGDFATIAQEDGATFKVTPKSRGR